MPCLIAGHATKRHNMVRYNWDERQGEQVLMDCENICNYCFRFRSGRQSLADTRHHVKSCAQKRGLSAVFYAPNPMGGKLPEEVKQKQNGDLDSEVKPTDKAHLDYLDYLRAVMQPTEIPTEKIYFDHCRRRFNLKLNTNNAAPAGLTATLGRPVGKKRSASLSPPPNKRVKVEDDPDLEETDGNEEVEGEVGPIVKGKRPFSGIGLAKEKSKPRSHPSSKEKSKPRPKQISSRPKPQLISYKSRPAPISSATQSEQGSIQYAPKAPGPLGFIPPVPVSIETEYIKNEPDEFTNIRYDPYREDLEMDLDNHDEGFMEIKQEQKKEEAFAPPRNKEVPRKPRVYTGHATFIDLTGESDDEVPLPAVPTSRGVPQTPERLRSTSVRPQTPLAIRTSAAPRPRTPSGTAPPSEAPPLQRPPTFKAVNSQQSLLSSASIPGPQVQQKPATPKPATPFKVRKRQRCIIHSLSPTPPGESTPERDDSPLVAAPDRDTVMADAGAGSTTIQPGADMSLYFDSLLQQDAQEQDCSSFEEDGENGRDNSGSSPMRDNSSSTTPRQASPRQASPPRQATPPRQTSPPRQAPREASPPPRHAAPLKQATPPREASPPKREQSPIQDAVITNSTSPTLSSKSTAEVDMEPPVSTPEILAPSIHVLQFLAALMNHVPPAVPVSSPESTKKVDSTVADITDTVVAEAAEPLEVEDVAAGLVQDKEAPVKTAIGGESSVGTRDSVGGTLQDLVEGFKELVNNADDDVNGLEGNLAQSSKPTFDEEDVVKEGLEDLETGDGVLATTREDTAMVDLPEGRGEPVEPLSQDVVESEEFVVDNAGSQVEGNLAQGSEVADQEEVVDTAMEDPSTVVTAPEEITGMTMAEAQPAALTAPEIFVDTAMEDQSTATAPEEITGTTMAEAQPAALTAPEVFVDTEMEEPSTEVTGEDQPTELTPPDVLVDTAWDDPSTEVTAPEDVADTTLATIEEDPPTELTAPDVDIDTPMEDPSTEITEVTALEETADPTTAAMEDPQTEVTAPREALDTTREDPRAEVVSKESGDPLRGQSEGLDDTKESIESAGRLTTTHNMEGGLAQDCEAADLEDVVPNGGFAEGEEKHVVGGTRENVVAEEVDNVEETREDAVAGRNEEMDNEDLQKDGGLVDKPMGQLVEETSEAIADDIVDGKDDPVAKHIKPRKTSRRTTGSRSTAATRSNRRRKASATVGVEEAPDAIVSVPDDRVGEKLGGTGFSVDDQSVPDASTGKAATDDPELVVEEQKGRVTRQRSSVVKEGSTNPPSSRTRNTSRTSNALAPKESSETPLQNPTKGKRSPAAPPLLTKGKRGSAANQYPEPILQAAEEPSEPQKEGRRQRNQKKVDYHQLHHTGTR